MRCTPPIRMSTEGGPLHERRSDVKVTGGDSPFCIMLPVFSRKHREALFCNRNCRRPIDASHYLLFFLIQNRKHHRRLPVEVWVER